MVEPSRREHYRAEYQKLRPHWKDSLALYRELVAENLPLGGRVLDLGCGHADWLTLELTRAALVCGADADMRALRHNVTHMHLVAARGEWLPFREGRFDLVTMAWVIEYLEYPSLVLREVRRVLRPGGKLVFVTPNAWNYHVWLMRTVPRWLRDLIARPKDGRQEGDEHPALFRLNTPRDLGRGLAEAGFGRRRLLLNGDPTYISANHTLFKVARGLERLMERERLQSGRAHLLGVYES
jgi:SAM-dependent methyltransferase